MRQVLLVAGALLALVTPLASAEEAPVQVSEEAPVQVSEALSSPESAALRNLAEEKKEGDTPRAVAIAVSVMLLGVVGFVMVLFYLVHSPDKDIREASWQMISATVSIFIAVLFFQAAHAVTHKWLDGALGAVGTSALNFLVWWTLSQIVMYRCRAFPVSERASGTLFGHLIGFAGIYCFGGEVEKDPFKTSPWIALLMLPIFFAVAAALFKVSSICRKKIAGEPEEGSKEADHLDRYEDQCQDTENDIVALVAGYIFSQFVRFIIAGELPPLEGKPEGRTASQVGWLLGVSIFLQISVFALGPIVHKVQDDESKSELVKRFVGLFNGFVGMSMSWCFLFFAYWYFFEFFSLVKVVALAIIAMCVTVVCVFQLYILDFFRDRQWLNEAAVSSLITAMGLLLGFSWEQTFDCTVDSLAESEFFGKGNAEETKFMLAFILVILVFPAWRLYILPKSDPELLKFQKEHPPLCAICTGEDELESEGEEESDEEHEENGEARALKAADDQA